MVRLSLALVLVLVAGFLVAVPASAYLSSYHSDSFFDIYFQQLGGSCAYTGSGTALLWTDVPVPPPGSSGTINVELLSLNMALSGPLGPMMFRESPTLMSTGQFAYSSGGGGGGGYHIDSFFDIFFEISLDSGNSWRPSAGSGHYSGTCDSFFDVFVEIEIDVPIPGVGTVTDSNLHLTPEPGSILALASGLIGLAALKLRRR